MSILLCALYPLFKNPTNHIKSFTNHPWSFLDASSHLYKRVCPSVCPSIRMSVSILKNRREAHLMASIGSCCLYLSSIDAVQLSLNHCFARLMVSSRVVMVRFLLKLSGQVRSARWGTFVLCRQGEKKGGGVFRGRGVNRKNTVLVLLPRKKVWTHLLLNISLLRK